jgi:hypothetical protein
MKAAECEEFREALLHEDDKKVVEAVCSKYPCVQYVMLMAICSQEHLISPMFNLQHPKFQARQRIQEYICKVILLLLLLLLFG